MWSGPEQASMVIERADCHPGPCQSRRGLLRGCRGHELPNGAGCRPLMKSAPCCAWVAAVKIARLSALSTSSNREQIIM
jgi:hypothetical protein